MKLPAEIPSEDLILMVNDTQIAAVNPNVWAEKFKDVPLWEAQFDFDPIISHLFQITKYRRQGGKVYFKGKGIKVIVNINEFSKE